MDNRDRCLRCGLVNGVRPTAGAKLGFYLAVAASAGLVVGAAFLGIGLVMVAPILAATGMAIGPLAEAAFEEPRCPACGRIVEPAAAQPAVAASPAAMPR